MSIDPVNIPSLLGTIIWPAIVVVALTAFRKPLAELIGPLGRNVRKISFAGIELELATATELRPRSLDSDLRELDAGTHPQSGPIDLLSELRAAGSHDYVVIDLGSDSAPRWLTSRLYLFGLLLARVSRLKCFVFVETAGIVRNRFVGTASPEAVRWALARRYPWLEYAYTQVYAQLGLPQFDRETGALVEWQATNLVQQFLAAIRIPGTIPIPFPDPNRLPDTVDLGNGVLEYARWADGGRIERVLGADLSVASITVPAGKRLDDMVAAVLAQHSRFVAVIETDRTFRSLVDRNAALESLATEAARQSEQ
jgi:hypothetical protein